MKAMIFAAGLGTRLRPLTNDRPKALVEIKGMPLLEITIRRLKYFGFRDIVVNIHHFGDQVIDFLQEKKNFGLNIIISDERKLLLDTGGGLKKAASFFEGAPFLVHNTDILTNMDLKKMYDHHCQSDALATLALRNRQSSRYLLFDQKNVLSGWRHTRTGEVRLCRPNKPLLDFAFSGIHVLNSEIFSLMPEQEVFSIIDVYLDAGKNHLIEGYPHDDDIWLDVGKLPAVEQANQIIGEIRGL